MDETLYIGFSAPFADQKEVDRLVRDLTAQLPLGALLDEQARQQLTSGAQPWARGQVSNPELAEDDFQDAFDIACRYAAEGVGIQLIVGEKRIIISRQAEVVRARPALKRKAADLLYGPRRG